MGKREVLAMSEGGGGGGALTKDTAIRLSRVGACFIASAFLLILAVVALLVYTMAPCSAVSSVVASQNYQVVKPRPGDVRLPGAVRPHSYVVSLIPFIWAGNFTFDGSADLVLNVTEPTKNITLHASQLEIRSTKLSPIAPVSDGTSINIASSKIDYEREFYVIYLKDDLQAGQYLLSMKFSGILNDGLQGFYRSSYKAGNETRWIVTTQFQSTYARKAFPCFDEPEFKARFKISIARPKNMTTVSNMPLMGQPVPVEGMPDYFWDHFMESVPMSTYLVAFTVSDFYHLSDGNFKVWARASAIEQARYALKIGPQILRYYEDYFQIQYPLPKTDMIAIPDFAAGAMENWGLITYRETAMLYEEGVSMSKQKQRVAMVISHELAHQWFGNLVTPSWWSDLWLNEGFATYVECLGLDQVEPKLRTLDQFVVNELQNVLQMDAYKSSHPIFAAVNHPSEIDEIFDSISYEKGASIIRMMEHFLTTPVFKRGVSNYLKSKAYDSAAEDDLWTALTEQAYKDSVFNQDFKVKEIMETWTLRTGFPVVIVTRDYTDNSAKISQKRFKYRNMTDELSSWWVPLSFTTQGKLDFNSTRPSHWMRGESTISIDNIPTKPNSWIIFNIKQTGYYRVNYDMKNWEMISDYLNDPNKYNNIGELNRAQIIDDSLNLAKAGLLDYTLALNLTKYLNHERSFIPWKAAFPSFHYMNSMLNKMPIYDKFKSFLYGMIVSLYDEVGFGGGKEDDDPLEVYKQVETVRWACHLNHDDCVRRAVTSFQNWRSSPNPDKTNPIPPNLKSTVYCTALREGGQPEWDFAWERYLNSNVGSEKTILLSAMGCTRETWILSRYLHWSITEGSGIRKQDASSVFSSVSENVIGHSLAFGFLRDKWTQIKQYFGTTAFTTNSMIRTTTSSMNTEFELNMLREFSKKYANDLVSSTATIQQALDLVEVNVLWMQENYGKIEKWLNENV